MYCAVLDKDCVAHYFHNTEGAINYLIANNDKGVKEVDVDADCDHGELWDEQGISIGYFYKIEFDD